MEYSEYRKFETEISSSLNEWFESFCTTHAEFSSIKSIYTAKKTHLNGIQFVAGFLSYQNENLDWKQYLGVPVMIELVMLWAYKTNRILDHKQEVWETEEKIKNTVLDHDLLLSCILQVSEALKPILGDTFETVRTYVFDFIKDLPVGFLIERDLLNHNHIPLERIRENWEQNYVARNIKFNSLYDFVPLIGYYLVSGRNIIPAYTGAISRDLRFSHVGQIINESDCVPAYDAQVKSYQDQFADLRNGIITFPIYHLLDSELTHQALKDKDATKDPDWQKKYFDLIKTQGIDEKVRMIAKDCHEKHLGFWNSILEREDGFLSRTYGLLIENKYFKKFDTYLNQDPNTSS